jgi:ribosomal protein S10
MSQHKDTGVAKTIDIESISKDIAELAKQLGNKVEGPVSVDVLKRVQEKIKKILTPAT